MEKEKNTIHGRMSMIDKLEMRDLLKPLEDRFKKFTGNQPQVYYDKLKFYDQEVLEKAVSNLTDTAKAFPTPSEIRQACREASIKHGFKKAEKGCVCCHMGYVLYRRDGKLYVGDCGHCNKGKLGKIPWVAQKDDTIYLACFMVKTEHGDAFIADTSRLEIYHEATPEHTNAWLREYHNGPSLFDLKTVNALRDTTAKFKEQSRAGVLRDAEEML